LVIIGQKIVFSPYLINSKRIFALMGGVILALISLRYTLIGILTILFFSCTIIPIHYFFVPFVRVQWRIIDILMIVMFAKLLVEKDIIKKLQSELNRPILYFLGLILFSTIFYMFTHQEGITTILAVRDYFYVLLFYVVIATVKTKEQADLILKWMFIFAIITSTFVMLEFLLEGKVQLPFRGEYLYKGYRPRRPGTSVTFFLFLTVSCIIFFNDNLKYKLFYYTTQLFCIISIFLSANRNMFGSSVFILTVLFLKGSTKIKNKMLKLFLLVSLIASISLGIIYVSGYYKSIEPYIKRFESVTETQEYEKRSSFGVRIREFELVWKTIKENFIIGISPAGYIEEYRLQQGSKIKIKRTFFHTEYLAILVKLGFAGLLLFLYLSFRYLKHVAKIYKSLKDSYYRSVILGLGMGYVGFLISALIQPQITSPENVPFWGVILALPEVIYRTQSQSQTEQAFQPNSLLP